MRDPEAEEELVRAIKKERGPKGGRGRLRGAVTLFCKRRKGKGIGGSRSRHGGGEFDAFAKRKASDRRTKNEKTILVDSKRPPPYHQRSARLLYLDGILPSFP